MTTIYNVLIHASGLTQREAAELHNVMQTSVAAWVRGAVKVPPQRIDELRGLLIRQRDEAERLAANAMAYLLEGKKLAHAPGFESDAEARREGWPCKAAHDKAVGMALAQLPLSVLTGIKPRA